MQLKLLNFRNHPTSPPSLLNSHTTVFPYPLRTLKNKRFKAEKFPKIHITRIASCILCLHQHFQSFKWALRKTLLRRLSTRPFHSLALFFLHNNFHPKHFKETFSPNLFPFLYFNDPRLSRKASQRRQLFSHSLPWKWWCFSRVCFSNTPKKKKNFKHSSKMSLICTTLTHTHETVRNEWGKKIWKILFSCIWHELWEKKASTTRKKKEKITIKSGKNHTKSTFFPIHISEQ